MSLASNQTITLLAFVHSCFITIESYELSGDIRPIILYGLEVSEDCCAKFPETGKSEKNKEWICTHLKLIGDCVNTDKEWQSLSLPTLLCIINHVMTDLSEKIKSSEKLSLFDPLLETIAGASQHVDLAYDDCIIADAVVTKVYSAINFVR